MYLMYQRKKQYKKNNSLSESIACEEESINKKQNIGKSFKNRKSGLKIFVSSF